MTPPVRRFALAAALAAAPLGGCSAAANLSADELLNEVDALVRIEGAAPDYKIGYLDRARTASWLRRTLYLGFGVVGEILVDVIVGAMVSAVFGDDDDDDDAPRASAAAADDPASLLPKVEMPVEHVRELLRELPDEVGSDLRFGGLAASRFGWLAHYDAHPLSRIVALDGLVACAHGLELPLFQGDLARFGFGPESVEFAAACQRVRELRPQRRAPAPGGDRAGYVASLAVATSAPRAIPCDRIQLVETLAEAYLAEADAEVRAATAVALRAACQHLIERLLLDLCRDRASDAVDVRLCAMEQVRRAGGPDAVPLLLAVMAADPAQLARGEAPYDPDPLVRLRLIHYCGQLTGERLAAVLDLPGRAGVVPQSPGDFLAVTALSETTFTSRLRTPAITALSWALQRPRVDLDLAWIREWRQERR